MKSGRGRLSSKNNFTEKTLRNRLCKYGALLPSCQSATCQSPSAICNLLPFESIAMNTLQQRASSKKSCCDLAVENALTVHPPVSSAIRAEQFALTPFGGRREDAMAAFAKSWRRE